MSLRFKAAAAVPILLAIASPALAAPDDAAPVQPSPVEAVVRGMRPLETATPRRRGEQWALIIGINYEGRQQQLADAGDRSTLQPLKNAVHDAEGIRDVLRDYYGYQDADPASGFEGDDRVALLTESAATFDAIETSLGKLASRVGEDDSVLVFFSGHGVRLTHPDDRVAILPYDVQLARGTPTAKHIGLRRHLFDRLEQLPARHKLVVLDCCYSGEIFHANFQPRSETDDRGDRRLQSDEAFQAMASCRAAQVASDGVDGHSPFTAALIDGLRRLPANDEGDRRVWANRLLAYVRPRFIGTDQVPDCRSLIGDGDRRFDGEFCFYPGGSDLFEEFRIKGSEQNLLRAMVASRQGNWWFQEMPWFIPSVREQILRAYEDTQEQSRASSLSQLVDPAQLRAAADEAAKRFRQQDANPPQGENTRAAVTESLAAMRSRHFRTLLETQDGETFNNTLKGIAEDLERHRTASAPESASRGPADPAAAEALSASDIHLLAVVQHSLGNEIEAERAYETAIERYSSAENGDRSSGRLMEALCRADYGEFLLEEMAKPKDAALQFRKADEEVVTLASRSPPPAAAVFRVFILCREADAWLQQNRWAEANNRLLAALDFAKEFASEHYLTAHVHRRRAWAQLIQWDIADAEASFRRANDILAKLAAQGVGAGEAAPAAESAPDAAAAADPAELTVSDADLSGGDPFQVTESLRVSTDFATKLAYLHNLHGLAMATRFRGETALAADKYRWLVGHVQDNLARLRNTTADTDTEQQLIERLVNTQERLGDCNLFGDPKVRDLEEAADDYRRAMTYVHQLRGRRRDQWRAILLYKQALALALPSPTQDSELAVEMCRRADEIFETQKDTASGLYRALGVLATPIVEVADASRRRDASLFADGRGGELLVADPLPYDGKGAEGTPTSRLREAILAFRDEVGRTPHRDQLELCLFASAALLEHGHERDRFQVIEDVDLLLSFCRLALTPHTLDVAGRARSDSRAYLRPYYDAALRARLGVSKTHVKELLEIHWEATRGTPYIKPERVFPVLSVFVLDGEGLLLVDLPGGEGRCVPLADHCDLAKIQQACQKDSDGVPLPFEIQKLLVQWKATGNCPSGCVDVWLDEASLRQTNPISVVGGRPLESEREYKLQFPFGLPDGFTVGVAVAE